MNKFFSTLFMQDGEYLKQDDYSFDSASYGGEQDKDAFKMGRNEIPRKSTYGGEDDKDSFKIGRNDFPRNDGIGERLSDYFFGPKGSNTGEYLKDVIF